MTIVIVLLVLIVIGIASKELLRGLLLAIGLMLVFLLVFLPVVGLGLIFVRQKLRAQEAQVKTVEVQAETAWRLPPHDRYDLGGGYHGRRTYEASNKRSRHE